MSMQASQAGRHCSRCGVKLSKYNPDTLCWPCQERRRATTADVSTTSLSLPSQPMPYQSAFTLRAILDTARRTKPIRLSDIGQALKHYRNLHDLTQRDLAALLGFDQSYISKLENGQGLRDIATLKHIASVLGIPQRWLGLTLDGSLNAQSSELIEIAPSVIRLSQTVREVGRADTAVNELWPLVLRLEAQTEQDNRNSRLLLTLMSAQAMLGVILGDLLAEENLWVSVHFFKKAVAIVEEHGDNVIKAEVYRGCGNELRKHKQYAEAIPYLEQALLFSLDGVTRGSAAALLARTYGEMGDRENFLEVIQSALRFQEQVFHFTPTFNPVMIHEVHVRGLIKVGEINDIPSLLEQDTTRFLSMPIAPQWRVISQITLAEAMLRVGEIDDGLATLQNALVGAEQCKLPHQVQRAIRALQVVEAYSPAKVIGDEAKMLLGKLSAPIFQLPSPLQ